MALERLLVLLPYIRALHVRGLLEGRREEVVLLDDDEINMINDILKVCANIV